MREQEHLGTTIPPLFCDNSSARFPVTTELGTLRAPLLSLYSENEADIMWLLFRLQLASPSYVQ